VIWSPGDQVRREGEYRDGTSITTSWRINGGLVRPFVLASYVFGLAAAFAAGAGFGAGQAKSKVTNLLQTSLSEDFTPGRDILIDLVEIPPNTALDRHWHSGEEFHYYLEGDP
jgi:hypothetical protein